MNMPSTIEKICGFVRDELIEDPNIELAVDQDLLSTGHVDSMGIMRLITFLEEEFSIGVPPEDVTIDHFVSLEAIAGYVCQRIGDG